ncbi:MAG: PocR ligand-binding domain-containing protein, partial [Sedimentisphaerales bacterium]|nr:PocR ligand-binding domain-containing protein [Sedimentisphaerales bacterium]
GENQELLGYRGADIDITARVGAQEALRCHVCEIERFNRLATAREVRVIELKRRINELSQAAGQRPPYESPAEDACVKEAETGGPATHAPAEAQPPRGSAEYRLEDLLDRDQIQQLLDSCSDAFGIAAAVIDTRGKLFVATRWQRICADFHRVNELTCLRCNESDTVLANQLEEGASFSLYECRNGLTDAASPILIEGTHVGNVFAGQFLLEPADEAFFRRQAAEFGFDEASYLEALSRVPVVSKERLPAILGYLTTCARLVAEMGLERIRSRTYEGDLVRRAEALDRANRELREQRAAALSLAEDANEARAAVERAQRSLQDSEERLRSMTAAAHDAIIMMDEHGDVSFWNHAAQIMFGYSQGEARARNLRDLLAPVGYQDACRQQVVPVREGGQCPASGRTLELTALRRNGEQFPIELSIAPVRLDESYQTVGIIRDISERRRTHEILDRKQKNLEAIFDAAPFGMLLVNEHHAVVRANDAVRQMSGQEYQEILGQDVCRALACARRPPAPDEPGSSCQECSLGRFIRATLESGTPVHGVEARPVLNDNGEHVRPWLSVSVVPVDIDGGQHVVVALHDITGRKRAEAELRETMDLKSQFISTVSHELRTPLTAIREAIIIVADEVAGKLKKDQKHFLGIARRNVDRLARLIDDVLDFQKLSAGKMEFQKQPHSVAQTVEDAYTTMSPHARKKKVHLSSDIEAGLPPAVYDSDRIMQVLTNLVSNAIKFTPEGGTVSLSARRAHDNLVLQISDSGMGIPKEALPKIFNRFYRVHRPGREIKGTGLGLAIVHKIVTGHGGRIDVESEVDKGTTFRVTLPLTARRPGDEPHWQADEHLETMLAEPFEG